MKEKPTGLKIARCKHPGCKQSYTGTYALQSLNAHKRKTGHMKGITPKFEVAGAISPQPPEEPEPGQPPTPEPPMAALPPATPVRGLPGVAALPIPKRPDVRAKLQEAITDINARLVFLRAAVVELEAMQREIGELEAEQQELESMVAARPNQPETPAYQIHHAHGGAGHAAGKLNGEVVS